MRTNIVIDGKLMHDTLKATGLRTLLRLRQQEQIKRFRGKLHWQGDLEAIRLDK